MTNLFIGPSSAASFTFLKPKKKIQKTYSSKFSENTNGSCRNQKLSKTQSQDSTIFLSFPIISQEPKRLQTKSTITIIIRIRIKIKIRNYPRKSDSSTSQIEAALEEGLVLLRVDGDVGGRIRRGGRDRRGRSRFGHIDGNLELDDVVFSRSGGCGGGNGRRRGRR